MDYDNPIALTGDILKQRIFSPLAYANVRRAHLVAIAAAEAARYAGHFPIAWRKRGDDYELVVVRSFLADGRGHPPGTQTSLPFLPIVLRAYPFLLGPPKPPTGARAKLIDATMADEPSDVGAPITLADGRPAKATTQRLTSLETTAQHFAQTAAIAQQLAALDLFEAWPLHFEDVAGLTIDIPDMWIVRQEAVDDGALAPVLETHGVIAADLIGLHRISLFRAGMLLANARAALSGETTDQEKAAT